MAWKALWMAHPAFANRPGGPDGRPLARREVHFLDACGGRSAVVRQTAPDTFKRVEHSEIGAHLAASLKLVSRPIDAIEDQLDLQPAPIE